MNALLEQFLAESRELLESCCDTFLTLETTPTDEKLLNNLFRYVHTIKGGSGLFEIEPYTRLLHVTEDSLSKAREGQLEISSSGIDLYLKVVDQLDVWLNQLESNGVLNSDAQQHGELLIDQIQVNILGQQTQETVKVSANVTATKTYQECDDAMLDELGLGTLRDALKNDLCAFLKQQTQPLNMVVYRPERNAFFSGDDPVSYWSQLPGLYWQGIDTDFDEQPLSEFDPYECRMTLVGLFDASSDALKESLGYVWDNVALHAFTSVNTPSEIASHTADDDSQGHLYQIVNCQLEILRQIDKNPSPKTTLASVQRVLCGLTNRIPELVNLGPVSSDAGVVTPDYTEALQVLLDGMTEKVTPMQDVLVQENVTSASMATKDALLPTLSEEASPNSNISSVKSDAIRTVKVDQEKLEQLVDLTGELIVAKNSLQHLSRRVEQEYGIKALSRDLKNEHAVLNRITESLQDVVMQVRMIPVSTIFQRFPRLVRDLSRRLGKAIDLQVEGEETEADKNIVEQLADPLIHLVRNSIDHGIEMPEVRAEAGKHKTGVIRLVAKNVQDSVQIEIHDDGAGIDPLKIKSKAIAKGIISEEQAAGLSHDDVLQLIFEPGFSTCEQVSDLSGRGVGMDVVKTTVSRIGGTIELQSETGKGSTIKVTLPASITVSRVMMFEVNEQVYGIPVEGLTETIKIRPEQINSIKQRESYVLRNKLIPLYRMHQMLGIRKTGTDDELPILNLNINGTMAGFAVDKLLEGVDVIIKPLEGVMARFPLYSGAAVLGDGRVLLVINPKEMALCH